ncbi:phenylalanine--tRNA ligase subunit beta [Verticiella sediminum]|uniref:Phenylalanine--tRNA ligase beta subunit n=1 Tax=Verticiella sediminum TaxID=1247510 RepID=A0A556AWY7_9BURK|nr:phenylalanine--tRNA ligase subunit beta [Verticiella sediminum]TSH97462.1 phenylalanine--tRNA ligase subunit beta [Verticiella sediminum]
MLFPESWLRAYVDPALDTDALAHALTMAGLEVEGTTPAAPAFCGIVVAEVLEVAPHPDADKLRVCSVDDGSGAGPLQIVCGAPNVAPGIKVPLARIGAELPGGMRIGKAKMRGVESFGMLCSARELGLSQDHAGLMLLDAGLAAGADLRGALALDDTIFEIKLTPNKADCLSVWGVAREVAAITGAPLRGPQMPVVAPAIPDVLPVAVQAADLCGRFAGRVIRGVDARAETPAYIRTRLERAGQRPISALVDISNYVMLELGRPSHVFDLDKLHGSGIAVRWAEPGERVELLNGQTVDLDPSVGVIVDSHGVESLAGIMGGQATSVSLDTTNIYLEAAFWWPEAIAGRSRRLNFSTDAGHRFERGVDYASIPEHIEYLTHLIVSICGGKAGPVDDQIVNLPERKPVRMRTQRCRLVLGVDVTDDEIAAIFTRLGLAHQRDADAFLVTPPSYRFDLTIEEDLIEEVARIYGFERIPDAPPLAPAVMLPAPERVRPAHALRREMADLGYQEVVNFSFVEDAWERDYAGNADPIRLLNPIASQLSVMRSSLIGGLLENVRYNANRKQPRVRVFELGRVFRRDPQAAAGPLAVAGVVQPLHLAGMSWGSAQPEQWGVKSRPVDFFDAKADVQALAGAGAPLRFVAAPHPALHPGRSARIECGGRDVGWIGELHPRWVEQAGLQHAPVVFEVEVEPFSQLRLATPGPLSRQPAVLRDLALWVDQSVTAQAMLDTIDAVRREPGMDIVQEVALFDLYRDKSLSEKEKSLAFRFRLQDTEVTLDDARVDECMARIRDALIDVHAARQRV